MSTSHEQKIESLERLLADEKGRRIAVERESIEVKRNAQLALDQAAALKTESEAAIATACDQLKQAMGISMGIYALGQLAQSTLIQKANTARVLFREKTWVDLIEALVTAMKGTQEQKDQAIANARNRIGVVRQNTENIRASMETLSRVAFNKNLVPVVEAEIVKDAAK